MDLSISDDQRLLEDSVVRFVRNEYEFDQRRALVDSVDGFSRAHWATFAELGWLALPFAEADGGLGGDAVDLMIMMEQFGRGLVLEPYLPCVLLAGQAIARAGNQAQRAALLGGVIAGETQLAFAHVEPASRFTLSHVETRAEAAGDGYRLDGAKAVVFNAAAADQIVVSARTAGTLTEADGISLFVVPANADGITLRPYRTVDGLRAAEVALKGVQLGADALLGEAGTALAVIEAVIDRATAAVCAEAVGAMDVLRETTLEYLKTRKQFGVPIGKFQVLQHRSVDMMIACEEARSLTMMATLSLDRPAATRARAVSAAKVHVGKAGRQVSQDAVQMHGGMGMTDELKVGHYFKRLTMIDALFGNVDHHLDRFAGTAGPLNKNLGSSRKMIDAKQLFDLSGTVAVVTGASRGIGRATAEAMASAGAKVVVSSRKLDKCQEVVDHITEHGGEAIAVACNIGHKDQLQALVDRTLEKWGQIDTLVCNAAVNPYYGPLKDVPDDAYDKTMNSNVRSNVWLCNMVIPQMASRDGGSVIVISSVAALIGSATLGTYGLSKAAVVALIRNLAVEWGGSNVRANCINPAIIRTDLARALWENPEIYARAIKNYPLKRIGEVEEIAGAAVFLASKAASFMTGQMMVIDGGSTISPGDV